MFFTRRLCGVVARVVLGGRGGVFRRGVLISTERGVELGLVVALLRVFVTHSVVFPVVARLRL